MAKPASSTHAKGLRRPPQITLALDEKQRVLYVNRELAGTAFAGVTEGSGELLHELIHPDCDGKCRFNGLLNKAWKCICTSRESVEWEIEDAVLDACLRMSLSRPPTSRNIDVERRRRFALLTATDVTEIRREYESVLSSNEELQRRIDRLESIVPSAAAGSAANDVPAVHINARILAAQERERRRIAADLHDGIAQTMGVIKFSVESRIAELQNRYSDLPLSELEPIVDQIREAIDDLRQIARSLSPAIVNEVGICTAIDMLCNEFGAELPQVEIECSARIDELGFPEAMRVAIYRVVQEALNNIGKHADPRNVRVALSRDESVVTLEIRDDGAGFDPDSLDRSVDRCKGLGLDSMRERVELTGGEFELRSSVGEGTTVQAVWSEAAIALLGDEPILDCE